MSNEVKNIVYHYCSPEVFKAIIENKSIRLSDITESNDSKEIIWNNEFIEKTIDSKINSLCKKLKIAKNDKNKLKELISNCFSFFFKEFNYRVYVVCFSYKEDLLSQWRGYAADATGFAIGFDLDELKRIGKPEEDDPISSDIFELGDVIYNEKEQRGRIKYILSSLFEWIHKVIEKNGLDYVSLLRGINIYFNYLFKNSLFFKNSFFSEEKEWRLCFYTKPDSNVETIKIPKDYKFSSLSYYLRDDRFISYIDLNFSKHPDIIKQIIIGPRNKSNMIEEFLNKNGFDCEILKSKGTYR